MKALKQIILLCFLSTTVVFILGCGTANPICPSPTFSILPAGATLNASAAAPGDQQKFALHRSNSGPGCATPASLVIPTTWTVSDPAHATISNALDATNGIATCTSASAEPIEVTLHGSAIPPATLTCR